MQRQRVLLRGIVQGVGFRPHVAQVAARYPLTGWCRNDERQVEIEVQGDPEVIAAFVAEVLTSLPPLAQVLTHEQVVIAPRATESGFRIRTSGRAVGERTLVPPDVATCADCLADLADPANRRYRYAFTTCTNCGPRLTIITDLPYDRPRTTMVTFPMCPDCSAEYTNPGDRRYHAQPISCFRCGPVLWLVEDPVAPGAATPPGGIGDPRAHQDGVLAAARERLRSGQIIAVKGIGGFHLMCDATNAEATARLRDRKGRGAKPFAVMAPNLSRAQDLVVLTPSQVRLLSSPSRPIVIAPKGRAAAQVEGAAPDLDDLGVLLPYSPLHTLLLDGDLTLVATSGNLSDEPLVHTNAEALSRLAHLADAFLLHDRRIHVPVEDSVQLALPGGGAIPLRRSRGHAPVPVPLPPAGDAPVVLAVGAEIKNTLTLAVDDLAFVSGHIGDMGSLAAQRAFEASLEQLAQMRRRDVDLVACDLHPRYATTSWAERYAARYGLDLVSVQHHHAHALSLLAEHGISEGPVVVAALDGTGYGPDATIWGGEVLTFGTDLRAWERTWHLPTYPLVGGDRSIRYPWRCALGVADAFGICVDRTPAVTQAPPQELALVRSQLASGVAVVATSSTGRLFDAAAAIVGVSLRARYEAEPAMVLEREAARWQAARAASPRPDTLDLPDLLTLVADPDREVGERAWRFHVGLAGIFAQQTARAAGAAQTDLVGLTGGVMANRVFGAALRRGVQEQGLRVLTHAVVPPGDGGVSLGQAVAARWSADAR